MIIKNSGKRSLIIKSVFLYAYDKKNKETYELGNRDNVWTTVQEKAYIGRDEAIKIVPIYGSIYDVFVYDGHIFDVTDEIKDLRVTLKVSELDGKVWRFKTNFTLGEIDDKIKCAATNE